MDKFYKVIDLEYILKKLNGATPACRSRFPSPHRTATPTATLGLPTVRHVHSSSTMSKENGCWARNHPGWIEYGSFTLQGVFPKKLPSSIHPSASIDVGAQQ